MTPQISYPTGCNVNVQEQRCRLGSPGDGVAVIVRSPPNAIISWSVIVRCNVLSMVQSMCLDAEISVYRRF